MTDISEWSPNAAENNDPPPDGFPEGQTAGSVNNSSRELMAADRRQWEDKEWFNWGHVVTRVGDDTFTVPGDYASVYHAGRRLRMTGTLTGTIYGTILSGSHSTGTTTVVVAFDDDDVIAADSDLKASVGSSSVGAPSSPVVSQVPVGGVLLWGEGEIPTGYVLLDGGEISRSTYAPLFALWGEHYGAGDGVDTFNVPDIHNVFVRGDVFGATGQSGGSDTHSHPGATAAAWSGNTGTNTNDKAVSGAPATTQVADDDHNHSVSVPQRNVTVPSSINVPSFITMKFIVRGF